MSALWHGPSSVCLTLVPSTQSVELLCNIFAPNNSLRTGTVRVEIFEKIKGF